MFSLFIREPEALDYVPKFSRQEIMMGYKVRNQKVFPGLGVMDDDYVERYVDKYSITVMGLEIVGQKNDYGMNVFDTIATIANEFTSSSYNQTRHPEVWAYLCQTGFNSSRRYWEAVKHREEIEATRKKAAELLEQVRRAEWIASMYAVQVKEERWLTQTEKDLLLAEFSGGEYDREK